jgi:nucleotide-binding universal stress UspA family protein
MPLTSHLAVTKAIIMLTIRTILHPTDFSEAAERALEVAHSLARDHNARLVLLAVPPLPPPPHKYPFPPGQTEYASVVRGVRQRVHALAAGIVDVPVEHAVHVGLPGPAILAAAREHHADLIVMGTHGRTGLTRLLMGSVAEYVMRHAPCPVLAIRPGASEHLSHTEETALALSGSGQL